MIYLTKRELYDIRDALLAVTEDEDFDLMDIEKALMIVEHLICNIPEDYEEEVPIDPYLDETPEEWEAERDLEDLTDWFNEHNL